MTKQQLLKEFGTVIDRKFAFPEKIVAKFNSKAFREGFNELPENARLNYNPYYNSNKSPRQSQGKKYGEYIEGAELGKQLKACFR